MKRKNLGIVVFLIFSLLLTSSPTVLAIEDITVFVDNEQVIFDVQPQLIGGRTMVPLRSIFEELGAEVLWDDTTQTVTAYNEVYIVKATIGENQISVNNEIKSIDVPPMIIDGRTLVPARFVAEAFNCEVNWDATLKRVYITTKEIDYTQVEQDLPNTNTSNKSHENDYQGANSTSQIDYYPNTTIPTYTSVVGVPLKRGPSYSNTGSSVTCIYECTDAEDAGLYWNALLNAGWSYYKKDESDNYQFTVYYRKGVNLISFTVALKYNEVWIIYTY